MTIEYKDSKRIQGIRGEEYYEETDANSGASMSNGGIYYAYGTEIRAGNSAIGKQANKWTILLQRNNSPQGVIEAHIYTGTEGATSKTHSQTSTNSFTVDNMSTSDVNYSFTFATPRTITAGDVIALVWKTDTSSSASNYVNVRLFNSLTDMPNTRNYMVSTANWNGSDDDNHTWSVAPSPYTTYTLTSKLELTDDKPTDVQDNSLFMEIDTARRYWFDVESTVHTASKWSSTGLVGYTLSNNDHTITKNTGTNGWSESKAQSVDTWTVGTDTIDLQFDDNGVQTTTMMGLNQGTLGYYFGSGSPINKADFSFYMTAAPVVYENGVVKYTHGTSLTAPVLGIKVSSTGVVTYWINGSQVYQSSSTASGTYFLQANSYFNTGTVEILPVTAPATWTMQPTLEDAFTSSTGWNQVTNTASGVSGGELIGLTNSSGTNGAGAWKDYGLVSDTKFVLRCKFDILAQSGGSGNASSLYFGISDTNGATSPHSNRDGLGLVITNYAASGILWCYPDGQTWDNADTDLSLTPTVTTYYLEIARTSATSVTFKLFSDEYSTVVKTHTQTIASTLNGLRYIMFQEWRNSSANTTKVAVDDLKIFNGVGTVN